MCIFLRIGKQIATLDSMSQRSIFYEYVNTIQSYLLRSVIILLKREWYSHGQKKECWATNAALYCLEIGFNSNSEYLGW